MPSEALEGAAIFVVQGFSVESVVRLVAPLLERQGHRFTAAARRRVLTAFLQDLAVSTEGDANNTGDWLASAVAPAIIGASE